MHSDDESLFKGFNVLIISLSLGAKRQFHIQKKGQARVRHLVLSSGNLLVMHGLMQNHYKHGLPAGLGDDEPRFNLTWRYITHHTCSGAHSTSGDES